MNQALTHNLCGQLVRTVREFGNEDIPAVFLYFEPNLPHLGMWEVIVRKHIPEEVKAA